MIFDPCALRGAYRDSTVAIISHPFLPFRVPPQFESKAGDPPSTMVYPLETWFHAVLLSRETIACSRLWSCPPRYQRCVLTPAPSLTSPAPWLVWCSNPRILWLSFSPDLVIPVEADPYYNPEERLKIMHRAIALPTKCTNRYECFSAIFVASSNSLGNVGARPKSTICLRRSSSSNSRTM